MSTTGHSVLEVHEPRVTIAATSELVPVEAVPISTRPASLSRPSAMSSSSASPQPAAAPSTAHIEESLSTSSASRQLVPEDPEVPEEEEHLEPWLEQLSILAHLACFAMLGVISRIGLEYLFGPSVAAVTADNQSLFIDVPANMAGSFLMGIVGFILKKNVAEYSQPLAIGLSTGYCGSLTTYASWNQRMIAIMSYGLVVRGLFGYLLGTAVAYYSFIVGIDTAEGIANTLSHFNQRRMAAGKAPLSVRPEHYLRRWTSLAAFIILCVVLWSAAGVVLALEESSFMLRKAALACVVGPPGCWLRWWLSRFNGQGLGKGQRWKWVPWGTLATNLGAVTIESGLGAVNSIVNTDTVNLVVGGLQSGFLGCMSTVSTLMQEVHNLRQSKSATQRSYIYLYGLTFSTSIVIGLIVYGIPVWTYGVAWVGYYP